MEQYFKYIITLFRKVNYSTLIPLVLVLITISIYWNVQNHEFVHFDDDTYVTENEYVFNGISVESLKWAFSLEERRTYWHPITWLSHMLDCELFFLDAGRHHFVNLLFHVFNTLLLFLLLNMATKAIWPSAFVAALFSLHPINVETVAWIAERKNLLSTAFFMLTMVSYVYYTKRPSISKFLLTLLLFAFGLMAKPAIIILPFIMLLFDFWPLQRTEIKLFYENGYEQEMIHAESDNTIGKEVKAMPFYWLMLEKIPFFFLSLVSLFVTSTTNTTIVSYDLIPLDIRIANVVVSYITYIEKFFLPINLAFFYPYPTIMPSTLKIVLSLVVIITITLTSLILFRKKPYLIVGWLWFLGVLVPVSGIIMNGRWPAMADRWAYIPFIGLFIIIAWGIHDLLSSLRKYRLLLMTASLIFLIYLANLTFTQNKYWTNDISLFKHAIAVTNDNVIAHNNLGLAFLKSGNVDDAIAQFKRALEINSDLFEVHINLGIALEKQGNLPEAIEHYRYALEIEPDSLRGMKYLMNALSKLGMK